MVFTVAEVAKILKVNKNYVYQLIEKGLLKALRLGSIKVPKECLVDFIRNNTGKDLYDLDNVQPLGAIYEGKPS